MLRANSSCKERISDTFRRYCLPQSEIEIVTLLNELPGHNRLDVKLPPNGNWIGLFPFVLRAELRDITLRVGSCDRLSMRLLVIPSSSARPFALVIVARNRQDGDGIDAEFPARAGLMSKSDARPTALTWCVWATLASLTRVGSGETPFPLCLSR